MRGERVLGLRLFISRGHLKDYVKLFIRGRVVQQAIEIVHNMPEVQ